MGTENADPKVLRFTPTRTRHLPAPLSMFVATHVVPSCLAKSSMDNAVWDCPRMPAHSADNTQPFSFGLWCVRRALSAHRDIDFVGSCETSHSFLKWEFQDESRTCRVLLVEWKWQKDQDQVLQESLFYENVPGTPWVGAFSWGTSTIASGFKVGHHSLAPNWKSCLQELPRQ